MFNTLKFLTDINIPYWTEGKNVTQGWVNITCPLCNDNSSHGGFSPEGNYNCWKCGKHYIEDIISSLLKVSKKEAKSIYHKYQVGGPVRPSLQKQSSLEKVLPLDFPPGTGSLLPQHRTYLHNRNFNSYKLEKKWKLKGTSYLSIGSWKWRIITPIYHQQAFVSYQGRDITNIASIRYKACNKENEIRPFKHCLYGLDKVPGDKIIIVEGITDVWRLGYGAVATFGIGYTWEQFSLMIQFNKCYILFDPGEDAQVRADELANKLSTFKQEVEILDIEKGDPAELPNKEAQEIMQLVR
jgi:hypothetical protein